MKLPATEKVVLAALADCANDEGVAWPAIRSQSGKLDLITMTSLSERSIQSAIKALCAADHLERVETPGRMVTYTVHPRMSCTPAQDAPPQEVRPAGGAPTPAADAPEPPVTPKSSSKASPSSKTRPVAADPFPKPEWADGQHWSDFLANRKRKRLPNTATAHAKMLTEVERFTDADWPPGRILQAAAERGWAGIYDPRERNDRNGNRTSNDRSRRSDDASSAIFAARDRLGFGRG